MRGAEVVEPGRTPAEVRLRLGVVGGTLAVAAHALTQAVNLPLLPTLLLVCSFGPMLAIGSAGLWELLGRHRRTATPDIGLVANLAAGIAVTLMFLAQLGLRAWFDAGLGGSAQQVSPEDAEAAFSAGNGLQLGLDMAWDVFLAIGTAMLAWNMGQHPRFGWAYAATGLLLAAALLGLNLATFPENPGRAGWIDVGPLIGGVVPVGHAADSGLAGLGQGLSPGIGKRLSALHDHAPLGVGPQSARQGST
jgi:hypothetical protein